jgi:hypothetical protein
MNKFNKCRVTTKGKGKFVPVLLTEHHAMKAYWVSGDIAPRILDLGIRRRRVVSFTDRLLYQHGKSPWYPLDKRLGGPHSRSGHGSEEKFPNPPGTWTPDRPARSQSLYRWVTRAPKFQKKVCKLIQSKFCKVKKKISNISIRQTRRYSNSLTRNADLCDSKCKDWMYCALCEPVRM